MSLLLTYVKRICASYAENRIVKLIARITLQNKFIKMRKIYITIAFLLATNFIITQLKARIFKVNGIEVYILAEPEREYEVVDTGGKGVVWGSFITAGLINESISTKVSKYIKKLVKSYNGAELDFDAVVYSNGKQMVSIKFTDEKTDENDRVATVQKIEGFPFYVMNEPLQDYEFIRTIGPGIKWKSALTAGIINNSIEQDLLKYARRAGRKFKKKNRKNVVIIYERGKKVSVVKLEEEKE